MSKTGTVLVWATITVCLFLLAFAVTHRQFLGEPVYSSPLFSGIVVWTFVAVIALIAVNAGMAIVSLFKRKAKTVGVHLLMAVLAISACIIATMIDEPTLLYAT